MNITRWEPIREVEDMFRQYSPLFSRAMRRFEGDEGQWRPVADISETDTEYLIKAAAETEITHTQQLETY